MASIYFNFQNKPTSFKMRRDGPTETFALEVIANNPGSKYKPEVCGDINIILHLTDDQLIELSEAMHTCVMSEIDLPKMAAEAGEDDEEFEIVFSEKDDSIRFVPVTR